MHQIHMRPKNGTQMPMCSFGTACNRKQCVYRHPPKNQQVKSSAICPASLLGNCQYGARCRNTHVSDEEAQRIRDQYSKTMCRFGSRCCTQDCLFFHPPPEPCQFAERCPNPYCQFAHPESSEHEPPQQSQKQEERAPALVFPKSKALLEKEERLREDLFSTTYRHPTVKVPADVWIADYQRNAGVYLQYVDPVEKLLEVNARSPRGVIDLHFQKTGEVVALFERTIKRSSPELEFWDYYDKDDKSVWVVTGSGNHTTHSRAYIFDVMLAHLENEAYKFKIAVNNGSQGGFLVYL